MSGIEQKYNLPVIRAASIVGEKGVPEGLDLTAELGNADSAFQEMLSSISDTVIGASGLTRFDVGFRALSNELRSNFLIFGAAMMVRGFELGAQSKQGEI